MMNANYNCLLMDLDGTLLDFGSAEREAIAATLTKSGLPHDEDTVTLYAKINAEMWDKLERGEIKKDKLVLQRFVQLLEELGAEGDPVKLNNEYMKDLSAAAMPFPGAAELLEELAEFATLAAITNGISKVQMNRLEKSGLLPYFDEVFVSEKLGVTKPSPKFFDAALRKLGVKNKEKVLVIGDSLAADIKGGNNAKLDTCWYNLAGAENTTDIVPTHEARSYMEIKQIAVGEEALEIAANREKRHTV
ncbi:YjjG family noncanonical pyrimidine nucleotidase [Ruminococcaceae bacterium OttesenSCG-928-I18]|nr:YjjG family noncanonical pyrimidine nucleotidase [Ruminococcaceae bacterium OttesenSCG-928-I18]